MLGERLAEIRKNYHDTQKSLADKLGLKAREAGEP